MKKMILLMLSLLCLLNLCSCIGKNDRHVIYFASEDGINFAEEFVKIDEENPLGIKARLITEALLKGPSNPEYKRVIPEGTALIGLRIADKRATVNLTQDFEKTVNDAEKLMAIYSVVNTLCTLEGISSVKILVNGRGIKYSSGDEEIGALSMGNVILADEIGRNQAAVLELYYADDNKEYLLSEKRMVDIKDNETIVKTAVEELLKGSETGKKSIISKDVELLSCETKDKICYINLSKAFQNTSENVASLCVYSLVNTITTLPDINSVQIFIEGEKTDVIGTTPISEPLYYNSNLLN